MTEARGRRITVTIEAGGARFQQSGKTIEFPGYLRAYVEGSDDPEAELADRETLLPAVSVGQRLECRHLEPKSHTTQPPNRYSEAALTRALEEMGIGRPSTYASIIDTILAREYVFKRGNVLVPTWVAFAVSQLLQTHMAALVDYQFTAEMEDQLDAISRGEAGHLEYLKNFYYGNAHPGLKQQLANKIDEINARDVSRILIGKPNRGGEVYVRVGRYGPFVEQGDRRASLPDKMAPDELSLQAALEMLDKAAQAEEPLGICPDTHKPVFLKTGRFGPYVQRGLADEDDKPQNASLLKGMQPENVDLATALKLLSLPRRLGEHPQTATPVEACNGRFGPYVKCGDETRSLPNGLSPLDVNLPQALELLAQPKGRRGQSQGRREPIKVFDPSPVTSQPIQLLSGRYGPYVTDGQTNASLPRGMNPPDLTFGMAVELLKARAEKAAEGVPSPRRSARRPARQSPAVKKPRSAAKGKKKSTRRTAK